MRSPRQQIGAEGIGCEPASAVTLAGLKKLVADGRVRHEDRCVLILTGHTLKDSDYTIRFHRDELLSADETATLTAEERGQVEALQRPPVVLEADREVVLRTLEAQMKQGVRA